MKPLRIGLTGGIASGKSTAADYFQMLGAPMIDADVLARDLTAANTPLLTKIIAHFGPELLTPTQTLNRQRLGQLIFQDKTAREWLEQQLHPPILAAMREFMNTTLNAYAIAVIPLLVETRNQIDFIDRVCVIDIPTTLQIARLTERDGFTPTQIAAILAAQVSREQRLSLADDILDNSQGLVELQQQIERLHAEYLNSKNRMNCD